MGKCEACNIDAPSLCDDEIKKLHPQIPSWSIIEDEDEVKRLICAFAFKDYDESLNFTNIVAKLAEELGIESETVKDDDAKLNRLRELRKEGYAIDEKDSTNYGTFLSNKDGDIKLIFNEAANTQDNVITTKAHEMLHAVVLKTVANNPGVAERLGTSLLDALKTINAKQTTGEYQRRLESYLKNPEISADDSFEEGLTLLSEAIINGDIVYKESIAQKIGRGLEKLFRISGTRAVFNDGKDVFNFIRDYNDSLIKGKVNNKLNTRSRRRAGCPRSSRA